MFDGGKNVPILLDAFVEAREVSANSDASVGFRDYDHARAPISRVIYFSDDPQLFHPLQLTGYFVSHCKRNWSRYSYGVGHSIVS